MQPNISRVFFVWGFVATTLGSPARNSFTGKYWRRRHVQRLLWWPGIGAVQLSWSFLTPVKKMWNAIFDTLYIPLASMGTCQVCSRQWMNFVQFFCKLPQLPDDFRRVRMHACFCSGIGSIFQDRPGIFSLQFNLIDKYGFRWRWFFLQFFRPLKILPIISGNLTCGEGCNYGMVFEDPTFVPSFFGPSLQGFRLWTIFQYFQFSPKYTPLKNSAPELLITKPL